jgi:5-oxoprolinase (ATP-hydrolysing) subunit A
MAQKTIFYNICDSAQSEGLQVRGGSMAVTINCDMGESYGLYRMGNDAGMMPLIDIANVACGFHASDFNHMRATVRLAKAHGVKVGAHPSLPDRQGFGRREMKMGRDEMANCLIYQIGALMGFLRAEGVELNHIKPHGSLYGMAAQQEDIAAAVCDAADVFRVPLLGMSGTLHETVYPARGHGFIAEFYGDLDYRADGSLIVTREHDAKDPDLMAARVVRAISHRVGTAIDGSDIPVRCETVCIHSDTPNALDIARAVRAAIS